MSRIGKLPIELPAGVSISLNDRVVQVKGPKGQLEQRIPAGIGLVIEDAKATFTRGDEAQQTRANHGLARSLAFNMVTGVSKGFEKSLEIHGIGYKADVKGKGLVLGLGFSHEIVFPIPDGVSIEVQTGQPLKLTVRGIDKQVVGQAAATITRFV